jgi:hypothetical protein
VVLIIGDDASSRGCVSRLLYAIVAQLVEHLTFNQGVFVGSSPIDHTNTCLWLGEQSCGDADKIEGERHIRGRAFGFDMRP